MTTLNNSQQQAMFRHQQDSLWVGDVHMLSVFHEYIPFVIGDKRYLMEFMVPGYYHSNDTSNDCWYKTNDGGVFIPKRDHRIISLLMLDVSGQLVKMPDVTASEYGDLAEALYRIVVTYLQSASNANQFFYQTSVNMAVFIQYAIKRKNNPQNFSIRPHDELMVPFYGFTAYHHII